MEPARAVAYVAKFNELNRYQYGRQQLVSIFNYFYGSDRHVARVHELVQAKKHALNGLPEQFDH